MSNILIILAHPNPNSLNHAIARTAENTLIELGHRVIFHDLYAEGFDPNLLATEIPNGASLDPTMQLHCDELANANGLVIVHPNWWGAPPAIMKGWIDRVFRPDVAYRFIGEDGGEGVPEGLLKAEKALVFHTANTAEKREAEVFGDPLDLMWRKCVFGLCGVKDVRRRTFSIVITSTAMERKRWLDEVAEMVGNAFPYTETQAV